MRVALTNTIQRLPQQLRRSLTWDQGKEMAEHARFSIDSGVEVYFCDPSSPWQHGSNEKTNGPLRQLIPIIPPQTLLNFIFLLVFKTLLELKFWK